MISELGARRQIEAGPLSIGVYESGASSGFPVVLLHGFPYDVQAYAEVAPILAQQDCRVIHSYRHRYGLVDGDPAYSELQHRLSRLPPILVPTITMDSTHDGVIPPEGTSAQSKYFTGYHDHRVVEGAGHNLPQEKPMVFARAVLDLLGLVR
jgi:pimeloyl-ACP methyl ester carboxylesterase